VYWYLNNSQSKGDSHNYEQMVFHVFLNHICTRLKNKTKLLIISKQYYPKVIGNASSKITPLTLSLFMLNEGWLNLLWLVAKKEHGYM